MDKKELSTKTGSHHIGRVHFPSECEEIANHESHITVIQIKDSSWIVNLGFLQVYHRYHVEFTIPQDTGGIVTTSSFSSPHVKVVDIKPADEGLGHKVTLEFAAHKEKLIHEKIKLINENNKNNHLTVELNARVLGKGQGTPLLKDAIHCIGLMQEGESELSDNQEEDKD